jgi:hypothetical protein
MSLAARPAWHGTAASGRPGKGRGVPRNQLPRALLNSFKKGDVIFQRYWESKRKSGKPSLKLIYVLMPSLRLKADVPQANPISGNRCREIRCRQSQQGYQISVSSAPLGAQRQRCITHSV